MSTKIITIAATPPTESTGADYNKGGVLNATEFDQNTINLRAAIDRIMSGGVVAGVTTAPQTTGFTIAGGNTYSKTLTVTGDATISGSPALLAGSSSQAFATGALTASGNIQGNKLLSTGDAASNLGELDLTNTGSGGKTWRIGDGVAVANGTLAFYDGTGVRLSIASTGLAIAPTTASTSTTTGALTVAGGVGIAGALNVGGAISCYNTVAAGIAVASTHKATMVIGGSTYYVLLSNV